MQRRGFLRGALALGCSAGAFPLITPIALAQAPWENRLVVVILRGAMDGLDVLRPVGDPDYRSLRPAGDDADPGLSLGGFWELHPLMAPLAPLWASGELGFAHAVSTPYRDGRSHFDGQDILEAGTPGIDRAVGRSGWLNRLIATVPGVTGETAFSIGREHMAILDGPEAVSSWSLDADLRLSPATQRLLEAVQHEDPLFRDASLAAIALAADQAGMETLPGTDAGFSGSYADLARFAASRLAQETRIASFSINGWDTHAQQGQTLRAPLTALIQVILTLRAGLGPVWGKTAVLCLTEFGRTGRQNGSGGTDHGTGSAILLAGGALAGGRVVTDWPGLSETELYERRDLLPTRDLRAHAGWVMRGLFGLDAALIEEALFPGLDLGADPGWIS